jgi:hypothetical protein
LSILLYQNQASAQWVLGDLTDSNADGQATLNDLQKRYNDTRADCGTNNRPAFLCSGILLRVTKKSDAYKVWNPSPTSVSRGAVSFSYLRADAKFQNFAWNSATPNGYIIYPKLQAPTKKALDVLCAYPNDSWEWFRDVPCGSSTADNGAYAQIGQLCSSQGITTAEQWAARWQEIVNKPGYARCGFNVNKTLPNGAVAFMESLKAKQQAGIFYEQNELQITTWPQNIASDLPIQAFFYTNTESLADAQANQREFYAATGNRIIVPIINVRLPTTAEDDAVFGFYSKDQSLFGQAAAPITVSSPPTIDIPAEGATVSSPFGISGKSTPNAIVTVMTAGGARRLGNPVADASGNWSIDNITMTGSMSITANQTLDQQTSVWADNRNFAINNPVCSSYIQSASWIERDDPGTKRKEWTLSVTPTACGRAIASDQTDRAYQELVQKYSNDVQWKDNDKGGMRRQLVCHLVIAREKAEWNLEPFRPDVSQQAAVAAGCNPAEL